MSVSRLPLEPFEAPCVHCGTTLYDEVRFCFECGAPVVPELKLPHAPLRALEELRTAAFSPVSIRPIEHDRGLRPGEPIEIESLGFGVAGDEVPIDLEDDDADDDADDDSEADGQRAEALAIIADPSGTVVALAPERPLPFWPAPPRGETVLAPAPCAPSVG